MGRIFQFHVLQLVPVLLTLFLSITACSGPRSPVPGLQRQDLVVGVGIWLRRLSNCHVRWYLHLRFYQKVILHSVCIHFSCRPSASVFLLPPSSLNSRSPAVC